MKLPIEIFQDYTNGRSFIIGFPVLNVYLTVLDVHEYVLPTEVF